ncbi:ABC transporter ATP-binding protein [Candidatus Woesearchaeota archaeon]|nr:ABC transporter ATP-binding protein [Candidatus Woesearchaeota archaeon]
MASIVLTQVSKRFVRDVRRPPTMLGRALSLVTGRRNKAVVKALDEVTLSIGPGTILGVIGSNGSGKTTLLRAMAGVYTCDGGDIKAQGKVISLINLFFGLQERLTMRDNILLLCSFFSLSRRDAAKRVRRIAAFAELEQYLGTRLYQFSAGMLQRLVFSVAIHSYPNILLLDEVFEFGDEAFKRKSSRTLHRIAARGGIVVLVSHDLALVRRHCSRIVRLDRGRIVADGGTEIIRSYLKRDD